MTIFVEKFGGAAQHRTGISLLKRQDSSHLSYNPKFIDNYFYRRGTFLRVIILVEPTGIEPVTYPYVGLGYQYSVQHIMCS